jgi:hypothetical protein
MVAVILVQEVMVIQLFCPVREALVETKDLLREVLGRVVKLGFIGIFKPFYGIALCALKKV